MTVMKPESKLQHHPREEERAAEEHQHTRETAAREFATPEELLRHDAALTTVPPGLAARLSESARGLPGPAPWWRRWLRSGAP